MLEPDGPEERQAELEEWSQRMDERLAFEEQLGDEDLDVAILGISLYDR